MENLQKKSRPAGRLGFNQRSATFTRSLPDRHYFLINDNNKDKAKKAKANNDVKECKHIIYCGSKMSLKFTDCFWFVQ